MAKQKVFQRYIFKIHSARLRNAKWSLQLPLDEARKNEEIIAMADSQMLRWIDELNGGVDTEAEARSITAEIRGLKKGDLTVADRHRIHDLYAKLDAIQFKPDYMYLIIDKEKDYYRACEGFAINGLRYKRLLGTNGGVKNSTIVFVAERHIDELRRRIDNGRNPEKKLVPAKLEAYRSLTCSASIPVSFPNGVIVVSDCETEFYDDVIDLSNFEGDEPLAERNRNELIRLTESDGYGLVLPSLAERWSAEMDLEYVFSGVNTRCSFEKGMVFVFDFIDFAEKVAGSYMVRDAWGVERDIRDAEMILTTSMLKLWDSYESWEAYLDNCIRNHYTFAVAKVSPAELENERSLNYQFIQSYKLSDAEIMELIGPSIAELNDALGEDPMKSILFLRGKNITESNAVSAPDDCVKALMIEPGLINDSYVFSYIYNSIRNRIDRTKIGEINVHGNYSIVCGDPFSLMQHVFGLPVTGLLKRGEIYNAYWRDTDAEYLACFRAPMTCHENIRKVRVARDESADYWYRYINTCTLFNSWDTSAQALNGMDKDGDLVMLTDNRVLVECHKDMPTLMCAQRNANKVIPTEDDLIRANISSFGNDIGRTTNWITSMFEVQSQFPVGSEEYEILEYRIRSGQLFQQDAIDKAKGIICKPMPKSWHDRYAASQIEDEKKRELYLRIVADRKPYFMRYIYPSLMKQYNKYVDSANKNCIREFRITLDKLLSTPAGQMSDRQREFVSYYYRGMPVGYHDCVMNRICRAVEDEFSSYVKNRRMNFDFDYSLLKSDAVYTKHQHDMVAKLYKEYTGRCKEYAVAAAIDRVSQEDMDMLYMLLRDEFIHKCDEVCPDSRVLCNIMVDVCYKSNKSKRFCWDICGAAIIENLLEHNDHTMRFPVRSDHGTIEYGGSRFEEMCVKVG